MFPVPGMGVIERDRKKNFPGVLLGRGLSGGAGGVVVGLGNRLAKGNKMFTEGGGGGGWRTCLHAETTRPRFQTSHFSPRFIKMSFVLDSNVEGNATGTIKTSPMIPFS
jgi:hypothetical protein